MKTVVSAGTVAAMAVAACVLVAPAARADTASAGSYNAVVPARVLDTRNGTGVPGGRIAAGGSLTFDAAPSLSAQVAAVVLTVTVVAPTAPGYLTVFAAGAPRPIVSNLNFVAGQTAPNMAVVRAGAGNRVTIYNGSVGSVDIVADISGVFAAGTPSDSGSFVALPAPVRIVDTRYGIGAPKARAAGGSLIGVRVAGVAGIPADASAVVVNVTAADPAGSGYLSLYQGQAPVPDTSTVNFYPHANRANLTLAALGPDGSAILLNGSSSPVDEVLDVTGYFVGGEPATDGAFIASTSYRVLDTRLEGGAPLPAQFVGRVPLFPVVDGDASPYSFVKAVSVIITVANPQAAGFLKTWNGDNPVPPVSNSNFVKGQDVAGSVVAPVNADGSISIYNGSLGSVDLIVDVTGLFYNLPDSSTPGRVLSSAEHQRISAALELLKHFKTAAKPLRVTALSTR